MRLVLSVAGDVQMDREVEALRTNMGSFRPVFVDIARDLTRVTKRQFETEGEYASGSWAPLSAAYAAQKARMVQRGTMIEGRSAKSTKILRLTERLMNSLIDANDGEHREWISDRGLSWGTSVPYAAYHQHGTTRMPQRRFLELTQERREAYARALLRYARTGTSGL